MVQIEVTTYEIIIPTRHYVRPFILAIAICDYFTYGNFNLMVVGTPHTLQVVSTQAKWQSTRNSICFHLFLFRTFSPKNLENNEETCWWIASKFPFQTLFSFHISRFCVKSYVMWTTPPFVSLFPLRNAVVSYFIILLGQFNSNGFQKHSHGDKWRNYNSF